jgi:hypothetical protein
MVGQYMRDSEIFDRGNYDSRNLVILGFLLCRHKDTRKAFNNLWGLINPECHPKIGKERVKIFMEKMLYFSIDLPLKIEKISDQPDVEVMDYLKRLAEKKDRYIYDLIKVFNPEVTREELENVMGEENTQAYRIREKICPELARALY